MTTKYIYCSNCKRKTKNTLVQVDRGQGRLVWVWMCDDCGEVLG